MQIPWTYLPQTSQRAACVLGDKEDVVSRVHLVFDFLDGAASNSANEFKTQYEEKLGILDTTEGL